MTVRSMEAMRAYTPGHLIDHISPTPFLMVVASKDTITAPDLALQAYARALEPKEYLMLEGGHFDAYTGTSFDIAAARGRLGSWSTHCVLD